MIQKKINWLLLLIFFFCFFLNQNNTNAKSIYLDETSYEGWDIGTTGSAKYLDGSTVLVCIFLDDKGAKWTSQDRKQIQSNLEVACNFLIDEGKRYEKDVELIYNFGDNSDLVYEIVYDAYFPGSCSGSTNEEKKEQIYDMYDYVVEYIHTRIPSVDIMEKYHTDSIGYLVFIDGQSDTAAAYSYYNNNNSYYEELAFIPIRWNDDYKVNPDTYAHEILHLFGARDLYTTKEISGISKEFVIYSAKEFPNDIMLGYATNGVSWEDSISSEISKLTAYFIGWRGYISELERFPSIKTEYTASFIIKENPEGNYDEYSLKSRKMKISQKTRRVNYLEFFIGSIISIYFIWPMIKNEKRAKKIRLKEEDYDRDDSSSFY